MAALLEPLRTFANDLTANFAAGRAVPAQPEDQLKGPTQQLLYKAGEEFDLDVIARVEALTDLAVRPDLGVSVGDLATGHLELKAPGKGARAEAFTDAHDRTQFKKLKDHPNLIYTDGNEWALYRQGERVGPVVRSKGDVRSDGTNAFDAASAVAIEKLLRDFLLWQPLVPSTPKALAEMLAPLTRLLRENVIEVLAVPGSALSQLADEWREYFFPEADDPQFADAYAQTVTYALLLARVEGEADLKSHAADRLDAQHGLLAQVLRVLAEPAARKEVDVPVDLLERVIEAVDPEELSRRARNKDLWLYFYEDFLAAYDPKLRKQRGVYFTPVPVVQAQVALVSQLLRDAFETPLGFAGDNVTVLDPAVGTGTYLLAAIDAGIDSIRSNYGAGAVAARASVMASNFHGFELLIGSYAVAHLRVAQRVLDSGGQLPTDGVQVYLTDTLESPYVAPPGLAHAPLFHRKLAEENERARHVKADVPILVCLGNPPYFRQVIEAGEEGVERMGGWVREGDEGRQGILQDFVRDAPGVHVKNLYNLYVYFWRWALWKVFENAPNRGIVSFISASSYLRGPGFAGMRKFMRQTFDDLWILDLGGEGRGARLSENVFAIQTPVAIAVGVRYRDSDPETPAHVRYSRIDGTRDEKYAALEAIEGFDEVAWQGCFSDWTQPFLPKSAADFFSWPSVKDLFPWQHSGVQFKRTWPIAPNRAILGKRWQALVEAPPDERAGLFRETRDRKVAKTYPPLTGTGERLPAINTLSSRAEPPTAVPYAYRTLDRQYCLADARLGDFLRAALWHTTSARQLYLTTLLGDVIGAGPAATVSNLVPDMHYFSGRGGKDIVPLWRDQTARKPNVTAGLLDLLSNELAPEITAEDLFAYCYAVLASPGYVARFLDELEVPGPHLPITRDAELFASAVSLGRQLIWLHTYGERLVPDDFRAGEIPQGQARCVRDVGTNPYDYPTTHSYDGERQELIVGEGIFAPVARDVRDYSVSGLDVVGSWLDYRMRDGAGRQFSKLDKIRTDTWPAEFTEELLHLLWVIECSVALQPELDETLARIVDSEIFAADDLPSPSDAERLPPD